MNRLLEHTEVDESVFDKFEPIIDKYMPDRGEGDSLASQMVTAVNKIIYKWYNDGDVYDNNYALSGWANDLSSFANWLYKYVKETRPTLERIYKIKDETGYEYILLALARTVLTEDFLSKYSDKVKMGSIYKCDGPFSWVDLSEYDDEEDDWYEEEDEDWEDLEEDYKESKYSLSEIEDAVSTSFGFNKKETKDYIKKASPEVLDALVAGFKAEASKSFLTDDLKKNSTEDILKEDYTPTSLEDEIIRIVGDDYENGYSLYKNIEMLKDDFINSFDYDFSKVDFNSLWALYNKLHDMGPKSFYDKYKDKI